MSGIEWLKPAVFFGSMLYAVMGVAIFWISFVIVDKITPYDLWDEIVEKKNVALAIVVGATAISIGRESSVTCRRPSASSTRRPSAATELPARHSAAGRAPGSSRSPSKR